jgi:hypothetical protein
MILVMAEKTQQYRILKPQHSHHSDSFAYLTGKQKIAQGNDSNVYEILSHAPAPYLWHRHIIHKEYKEFISHADTRLYHAIHRILSAQWPRHISLPYTLQKPRTHEQGETIDTIPIKNRYGDLYTKVDITILPLTDESIMGADWAVVTRPKRVYGETDLETLLSTSWQTSWATYITAFFEDNNPNRLMKLVTEWRYIAPTNCMLRSTQEWTLDITITDLAWDIPPLCLFIREIIEDYRTSGSLEKTLRTNNLPLTDDAMGIMEALLPYYTE